MALRWADESMTDANELIWPARGTTLACIACCSGVVAATTARAVGGCSRGATFW